MKLGPIPITLDPGMGAEEWMLVSPLEDGSVFVVANDAAADHHLELKPGGFHYSGRAIASPGMFDPAANMKAAAAYVRKRFGLHVTHGEWPPLNSGSFEHYTHFAGLTDDYVRRHIARARLTRSMTTFGRDLTAAAYATKEHEMQPATTPYDRRSIREYADGASPSPYGSRELNQRAEGVTLADLDTLAKRRWLDGHAAGSLDEANHADARFADVYREGWQAGHAALPGELSDRLGPRAHIIHALAQTGAAIGLPAVPYQQALAAIGELMWQLIREFNDPELRELPLARHVVAPLELDERTRGRMNVEQAKSFEAFAQALADAQQFIAPEATEDASTDREVVAR